MQQGTIELPPLPHCSSGCGTDDESKFQVPSTVPRSRPNCETWCFAAETCCTVRDWNIQWPIVKPNLQRRLGCNRESGTLIAPFGNRRQGCLVFASPREQRTLNNFKNQKSTNWSYYTFVRINVQKNYLSMSLVNDFWYFNPPLTFNIEQ